MKKIAFFALSIFLLSCGSQKKISSTNFIKVSDFSIVTNDHDTLYLKRGGGDGMADLLKEFWDKGLFCEENEGNETFVFTLSPDEFAILEKKCCNSNGSVKKLVKN
jgi:hypothetical protein